MLWLSIFMQTIVICYSSYCPTIKISIKLYSYLIIFEKHLSIWTLKHHNIHVQNYYIIMQTWHHMKTLPHSTAKTQKLCDITQLPFSTAFKRDDGLTLTKVAPIISMMLVSLPYPKINWVLVWVESHLYAANHLWVATFAFHLMFFLYGDYHK